MSIKGRLWQLKLVHLALIYAIHGRDDVCKNTKKELLLSLLYECKYRCMYQRKKEEGTPRSRGGDDGSTCWFIIFDVFYSSLLSSFLLTVDVIIIVYALKL